MSRKLNPGELTQSQARREILSILARIPDAELPKPRIESDTQDGVAWFGSIGWSIRPVTMRARSDAKFRSGPTDAMNEEWLHRERLRRYGSDFEFRDGELIGGDQ